MKYCLSILILFFATIYNSACFAEKHDNSIINGLNFPQQPPFYFLNPVPVKVRLFDKIDLSFFRNQLVVLMYRYRLEVPDNESTGIDMSLRIWSKWQNYDLNELKIPELDEEGGYKLVIEYTISGGKESKRFEKPFYVYRANMVSNAASPGNNGRPSGNTGTQTRTQVPATAMIESKAQPVIESGNRSLPPKENTSSARNIQKITEKDTLLDLTDVKVDVEKYEGVKPEFENQGIVAAAIASTDESGLIIPEDSISAGYSTRIDSVPSPAEGQNDVPGLDSNLYTDNILYLLNDKTGTIDTVSKLQKTGLSLDMQDRYGNTPLHFAAMSGLDDYASTLIELGANTNLKNYMELSPLHIAVLRNDEELTDALINSGAEINIQGNTGYTALHIATELNNPDMVNYLLSKGANAVIKTSQGLSSKAIARIQKNDEILRLLAKKSLSSADLLNQIKPGTISIINSEPDRYPEIDFNLPYDKVLAKKRQFNQVLQIVSIPIFIVSSSYVVHLKSQANHFYSLSKIAESEEMARVYYEKTTKFDRTAYISGGISLVSAFGIIRSVLKKKSISAQMYKTINQGYIISK